MFYKFSVAAMAAFISLATVSAHADTTRRGGALAGTTLLQIRNATSDTIVSVVAVQHSFFFGSSAQNLLHVPYVRPGNATMVQFPSCFSDIHIVTKLMPSSPPITHSVYNFNVCAHTTYTVTGWNNW